MEVSSLCAPAVPAGRSRGSGRTERRVSAHTWSAASAWSLGLPAPLHLPALPPGRGGAHAARTPQTGRPLTFRHDFLRWRRWGLQGPQRGHAETRWEGLGRGAEHAAVVVPRPEAFPPGGCAAEHFVVPLYREAHTVRPGWRFLGAPRSTFWRGRAKARLSSSQP